MNNNKHESLFRKIITSPYFGWIHSACLLLVLVFLFTYVSFAWLRREWTPYVYEEGITVSTSGSLAFQLVDSSEASTGMSINNILKLNDEFVLKPVSSVTGKSDDFFTRNQDAGVGHEKYQYLNIQDYIKSGDTPTATTYSQMGIENGYIEFQLSLIAPEDEEGLDRYIYIHDDSEINVSSNTPADQRDVLNCIRVSITIQGGTVEGESGKTYIFAANQVSVHTGVYNEYNTVSKLRYLDGVDYYDSYTNETTYKEKEFITIPGKADPQKIVVGPEAAFGGAVEFMHFDDLNGGEYGIVDGENKLIAPNSAKTLFSMNSSITQNPTITVRIWAEGTHPDCNDDISGAQIDLKLQFASFTQERSQN